MERPNEFTLPEEVPEETGAWVDDVEVVDEVEVVDHTGAGAMVMKVVGAGAGTAVDVVVGAGGGGGATVEVLTGTASGVVVVFSIVYWMELL